MAGETKRLNVVLFGEDIYDTDDPTELLSVANAVIGVFSAASRKSFRKLRLFSSFLFHFREHGGVVCLVGTHSDANPPQVSLEESFTIAHDIGTKLFPVCVKTSKEGLEPWEFLLNQYALPVTERVSRTVEPLTVSTTSTITMITSAWIAWTQWLESLRSCLGIRKARSEVCTIRWESVKWYLAMYIPITIARPNYHARHVPRPHSVLRFTHKKHRHQ